MRQTANQETISLKRESTDEVFITKSQHTTEKRVWVKPEMVSLNINNSKDMADDDNGLMYKC